MSNGSLGDLIKKLAGEGGSNSSSTNNEPKFKAKPVNEGQELVPEFKAKTEFFEKQVNKSDGNQ